MATYQFAGMYGPETVLDQTSKLAAATSVTVYTHGTSTPAQLYSPAVANGVQTLPVPLTSAYYSTNPVSTDTLGNLLFWAAPGAYDLAFSIQGVATTKTVVVRSDPAETGFLMPILRARIQTATTLASGSNTLIFETATVDSTSSYNTSTGSYAVPSAGKYLVSAVLKFGGQQATSTNVNMWCVNTGAATWAYGQNFNPGPFQGAYASDVLDVAAGGTIQVVCAVSATSSLQLDVPSGNVLYIVKVSD